MVKLGKLSRIKRNDKNVRSSEGIGIAVETNGKLIWCIPPYRIKELIKIPKENSVPLEIIIDPIETLEDELHLINSEETIDLLEQISETISINTVILRNYPFAVVEFMNDKILQDIFEISDPTAVKEDFKKLLNKEVLRDAYAMLGIIKEPKINFDDDSTTTSSSKLKALKEKIKEKKAAETKTANE